MGTVRIPLHSRKYPNLYAVIDEEDYELVSRYRWYPSDHSPAIYACSMPTKRGEIRMHRLILNAPDGILVDHKNGNTLDNRRCNLRLATHANNAQNGKVQSNNSSGFKGVCADGAWWRAEISVDSRRVWLGRYVSSTAAASAYDHAAREYHGEFAKTNQEMGLLKSNEVVAPELLKQYRVPHPRPGSSIYRGVIWHKDREMWRATVYCQGKQHYVGHFESEVEAAMAHDEVAVQVCGGDARLNFPTSEGE